MEITDEMVRVAAEAIEDVAIARIGRDLGTLHRGEIVRAGLEAAAPLIAEAAPRGAAKDADFWFKVAVNTAARSEYATAHRAGREDAARDVEAAMYAESERLANPTDDESLHQRGRAADWGIGVAKAMNAVVAAARGQAASDRLDESTVGSSSPDEEVLAEEFRRGFEAGELNAALLHHANTERLRAVADAAITWRRQFEKPVKLPRMAALIAAVDALIEESATDGSSA